MNTHDDFDVEPIHDVPNLGNVTVERPDPYGSVPGLDKDELADPHELASMAFQEQWGPILSLPERYPRSTILPQRDESGKWDLGAFETADFDRIYPFDSARYKADKIEDECRSLRVRFELAMERVPGSAKHEVLSLYRRDVLELDHITDENMRIAVTMDARIRRKREEIRPLRDYSRQHGQHSRYE